MTENAWVDPRDPIAFARQCEMIGREVLRRAGRPEALIERLDDHTYGVLKLQLEPRSHEATALELWSMAGRGRDMLIYGERTAGFSEAVAGTFAYLGMLFAVFQQQQPGGLASLATTGAAVVEGAGRAKGARSVQAEQEVMDRWGTVVLQIVPSLQPGLDRAKLVRGIREAWPKFTSRRAEGNLPSKDRTIADFLKRHGF